MTLIEQVLEHKRANQPFSIYLNDGRRLRVRHGDFVSTHPKGKGTNVIVYGEAEEEEHFVPVFAITNVTVEN